MNRREFIKSSLVSGVVPVIGGGLLAALPLGCHQKGKESAPITKERWLKPAGTRGFLVLVTTG